MSEGQMAWFMPELNKLHAENERLRAALGEIAKLTDVNADEAPGIARRALDK